MRYLVISLATVFAAAATASQDQQLPIFAAEIWVNYKIEPAQFDACDPGRCASRIYQGEARLSFRVDHETGYLKTLDLELNGKSVNIGGLNLLANREVKAYSLQILSAPNYVPDAYSEAVLGPRAYIIIDGIMIIDSACEHDASEYRIVYYLEDKTHRVDEFCWEP